MFCYFNVLVSHILQRPGVPPNAPRASRLGTNTAAPTVAGTVAGTVATTDDGKVPHIIESDCSV